MVNVLFILTIYTNVRRLSTLIFTFFNFFFEDILYPCYLIICTAFNYHSFRYAGYFTPVMLCRKTRKAAITATDIQYPSKWHLRVPGAGIDVEIVPLLPDQELNLSFRYWEGAVSVRGISAGEPITGQGYVELTGYE